MLRKKGSKNATFLALLLLTNLSTVYEYIFRGLKCGAVDRLRTPCFSCSYTHRFHDPYLPGSNLDLISFILNYTANSSSLELHCQHAISISSYSMLNNFSMLLGQLKFYQPTVLKASCLNVQLNKNL
jgi:hypothetical protein